MTFNDVHFCIHCGSALNNRFVFGVQRPACPKCGWVYYEDPKVAVGVLVKQDGCVLLVRRLNEPMLGFWSIPAGFMDAHEDPRQAAERECLEETGIITHASEVAAVIGGREHPNGADIVIVYHAEKVGGELRAGDDAGEVAFFSRDKLPPLAFRATRIVLNLE